MEFKHLKIRTTLLAILLLFSGVLVVTSINAWFSAKASYRALVDLNKATEEQTIPATNTLISVLRSRLGMIAAAAEYQNGNLEGARLSREIASQRTREAADLFRRFMQVEKTSELQRVADRIAANFSQYEEAIGQLSRALDRDDNGAFLEANLQARDASTDFFEELQTFQELMALERRTRMEEAQSSYDMATLEAVVVTLLSLFLVSLSLWLIRQQILGPIKVAQGHFHAMAAGDLTSEIDTSSDNEVGDLFRSLHSMQQTQRKMIRSLTESSSQLASAAEELNSVTEESQRGLQEQSDQLQQAATAITELSTAVDDVAGNAVTTSEASQASNILAGECRQGVGATTDDINSVVEGVQQTSSQVAELAENSRNIGQILDVIHDVAEQTNLLALNAAIEAARAGEAGRGFAVVADEVRTLAQRTQASTTEIERLILSMRQGTESVIQAMSGCRESAERTLAGAGMVSSALEEIFGSISQINDRNLVIASAAEEQAQVAREVDQNLVNIRDLATQTAAGANQTSAASQELSRLAVEMHDMVVHFRT